MNKDTLLRFNEIIAEQANRLNAFTTKFVLSTLKTSDVNVDGFENAADNIITLNISNADVFGKRHLCTCSNFKEIENQLKNA